MSAQRKGAPMHGEVRRRPALIMIGGKALMRTPRRGDLRMAEPAPKREEPAPEPRPTRTPNKPGRVIPIRPDIPVPQQPPKRTPSPFKPPKPLQPPNPKAIKRRR